MNLAFYGVAVSVLVIATLDAATITVSKSGMITTINGGVAAANPGDTVLVKAGTYHENVSIPAGLDGLKLKAAGKVVVDARGPMGVGLGPGIVVDSAGVSISGFVVQHAKEGSASQKGYGIHGKQDGLKVSQCTIRGCRDDAIRVDSGDGTVIQKCAIPFGANGVFIEGNGTKIDGLTVHGVEGVGIEVKGAGTSLKKCVTRRTGKTGIEIAGDTTSMQNCSVRNADGEGVILNGASATVRKCAVFGAITALNVSGDSCVIEKNDLRACVNGAIQVNGALATIVNNRIEAMTDSDCINTDGDSPTIADNRIEDGMDNSNGIYVINVTTSGVIARNTIRGMSTIGIHTDSTTTNLAIESNTVVDHGGNGNSHAFLIQGSGHVLRKNVARRGMDDGFHVVAGSNVTLDGNKAIDNGEDGIDLQTGTGSLMTNNVATGNGAEGIENDVVGTIVLKNVAKGNRIDFASSTAVATFSGNVAGDGSQGGATAPEIDN